MASESSLVEVRFAHLLKPIRDLAENWDVDVASELEDYLEEIGKLAFSFDDNSKEVFNFAEAALLIQGSACIYSKKVEYLYKLVYETLDNLANKKKQAAQSSSLDANGKDRDVQDFAEDELSFLPLDDIPESKNIDLDENGAVKEAKGITRTPMVLVPLEECEKTNDSVLLNPNGTTFGNKSDFKMNTSIIHESGTLLLGVEDAAYVDQSFQAPNVSGMLSMGSGAPPPADNEDNCAMQPEGMPYEAPMEQPDFFDDDDNGGMDESFGGMDADEQPDENPAGNDINEVVNSQQGGAAQMQLTTLDPAPPPKVANDPWAPLDPYEVPAAAGPKNLFRRIKSYRIPSHLVEEKSKGGKKKKKTQELPLPPISQFCIDAFLPKSHSSVPKGFRAPAFKEFSSLCVVEEARRRTELRKADAEVRRIEREQALLQEQGQAAEDVVLDPLELSAVPLETTGDDNPEFFDDGPDDFDDGDFATVDAVNTGEEGTMAGMGIDDELPDFGAAMPEAAAAALTFEDLVRKHIEGYIAETQQYAVETDLTRRVQEWEDRIRPSLEEEAARKPFDIHLYGKDMLMRFRKKGEKTQFSKLVGNCSKYDVSRLFLATLQLANAGNVEIVPGPSGHCGMQLKLLNDVQNCVKDNIGNLVV